MKVYTDGATSNNGQENANGGWAFAVVNESEDLIAFDSGHISNATNNICELTAVINACKWLEAKGISGIIFSDSAYIINCYKDKWYKKWQCNGWMTSKKLPVLKKELWKKLIPYFENPNYSFEKVKGHYIDKYNNLADALAVEAKNVKDNYSHI